MSIEETLANLGFDEATCVKGRASVADLFKRSARYGIYVLHFSRDEYYAGKAIDVTRRYVQHRKVHTDIERISFKCVPESRLKEEEPHIISTLEASGFWLRSIQFTRFPVGASDLDTVIPPEEQDRWLADLDYQDLGGSRATNGDLRRKYTAR